MAKLRGPAAVAELVDAQASGACVLRDVEVRVLSAASRSPAQAGLSSFRRTLPVAKVAATLSTMTALRPLRPTRADQQRFVDRARETRELLAATDAGRNALVL